MYKQSKRELSSIVFFVQFLKCKNFTRSMDADGKKSLTLDMALKKTLLVQYALKTPAFY